MELIQLVSGETGHQGTKLTSVELLMSVSSNAAKIPISL